MNYLIQGDNGQLLARLGEYARQAEGAFAGNTTRAVRSDLGVFGTWCREENRQMLPASPETLAAFVDAMASTRSPATLRRYLASIAHLHRAAGLDSPTKAEVVRMALRRACKIKGVRQDQALGLTRSLLDRLLVACEDRRLIDLRDRALISLAYDTLARRSELVALKVGDIAHTDDGCGTGLIRRSKTDQEGQGSMRFLAADTVRFLRQWLDTARLTEGTVFRSLSKGGRIGGPLEASAVSRIYKRRAAAAGLDLAAVQSISGHSTRVGAAQDLAAAGLGVAEVMQAGGWKSPAMVGRYCERQQARRGAMFKLAASQNRV